MCGFAVCLQDNLCEVCFQSLHRGGNRKLHATKPIALHASLVAAAERAEAESKAAGARGVGASIGPVVAAGGHGIIDDDTDSDVDTTAPPAAAVSTTGYLRFGPIAKCVVHALKGLASRAPVLLTHADVTENIIFFNVSQA